MEMISVVKKKILIKVTGSLNTKIPRITVPTAPMPAQTAYAVPVGIGCDPPIDLNNRNILMLTQTRNEASHKRCSFPEVCCIFPKLIAKIDSNRPPIIKIIQLIFIIRI